MDDTLGYSATTANENDGSGMVFKSSEFIGNEIVLSNGWVETISGWRWINIQHGLEIERQGSHSTAIRSGYGLYRADNGQCLGMFDFLAEAMAGR